MCIIFVDFERNNTSLCSENDSERGSVYADDTDMELKLSTS